MAAPAIYNTSASHGSVVADSGFENGKRRVNLKAEWIVTANPPGCMLQLRAGVARCGSGQRVLHVVEALDAATKQPSADRSYADVSAGISTFFAALHNRSSS